MGTYNHGLIIAAFGPGFRDVSTIHHQGWTPISWQRRVAVQQPDYPDRAALQEALAELASFPPLVTSWEVNRLRSLLADAEAGNSFVLQGGDCAESFADCQSGLIANRLKVLLQMSLVMVHGLRRKVVRIGRFAGQYAKPRSSDTETRNGVTLPCYRGDLVNAPEFEAQARAADPRRLLEAHKRSAMTMNFIRGLIDGGFADLHHPEYWDLAWVHHAETADHYRQRVEAIGESLRFMETLAGQTIADFNRVEFYSSHEALLLCAEAAQTRRVPRQPGWYNLSTHFPWIGMRTAAVDGAHVEYCRGISNPVGVKIGPAMDADWLHQLCSVLNPDNQPGRLVLIPCTATRKPWPTASRPARSPTSCRRSSSPLPFTPPAGRAWAECTWN